MISSLSPVWWGLLGRESSFGLEGSNCQLMSAAEQLPALHVSTHKPLGQQDIPRTRSTKIIERKIEGSKDP